MRRMKIVSFGDVHMATANLARMGAVLRDTDLIIVSGDLTNFGGPDEAAKVIDAVRGACRQRPRAARQSRPARGNSDAGTAKGSRLHGKGVVRDGIGIFGCGGSNITPFKTPTELTEDEIYDTLMRGYAEVRDVRPLLMICHTPPFETKCDRIAGGHPVGSTAARRFIEEVKPDACLSGHIHESAAVDTSGRRLSSTPDRSRMAAISSSNPPAASSRRGWSFFEVPALSRIGQSAAVYAGKLWHGWPLVWRGVFPVARALRSCKDSPSAITTDEE